MLIDVSFAPKCMIEYDADVKFPPSLRRIKNRPLNWKQSSFIEQVLTRSSKIGI